MRKPIIAGNWKMNNTPEAAVALISELIPLVKGAKAEVVVCPPFVSLMVAAKLLEGTNIALGAQNMHSHSKGAFTGEVSAEMLVASGVKYVILGHSERRQYFGETDDGVNKKAKIAFEVGLTPIICVGESLEQRQNGITREFVSLQTKLALKGFSEEQATVCVIAYEPIWAIGTGVTATSAEANETCGQVRDAVREILPGAADKIRIQYGGSMNAANAAELNAMLEIDGGLIGGASLKAGDFSKIVHSAG